jgi:predicted lipoprotein with Yx(FWY)xxD motif
MRLKLATSVLAASAAALVLASCGSSTTASKPKTSNIPVAPVKLGTVTINGTKEKVLTNLQGYTLYWFKLDTPTKTACVTAVCKSLWTPVLTNASKLRAPSGIPGTFTVVKDALGNQVAYNGYLLYTFTKDTGPGQANGQGFKNVWFVVTPGITPRTASSSSSKSGY